MASGRFTQGKRILSTRLGVFSSSENTVVWGIMGVTGG